MNPKILIEGCGNAGMALVAGLPNMPWPDGERPTVELVDSGVWQRRHAEAGLIDEADVDKPKQVAAQRRLQEGGWPAGLVHTILCDVRDRPRGAYRGMVVLALTDSHETKDESVRRAAQVGSPAIAVGLDANEAVIECFSPTGACYACVHGRAPDWSRRMPCMPRHAAKSTTEILRRSDRPVVQDAGEIVARLVWEYLSTGEFCGGIGMHLCAGTTERFRFALDAGCEGPHDPPLAPDSGRVLRYALRPAEAAMVSILKRIGRRACYADRELAWQWWCQGCRRAAGLLHTVHPAPRCHRCGGMLEAGLGRATGLTADELEQLGNGLRPTLARIGLAEESILRCLDDRGEVVWVELEA